MTFPSKKPTIIIGVEGLNRKAFKEAGRWNTVANSVSDGNAGHVRAYLGCHYHPPLCAVLVSFRSVPLRTYRKCNSKIDRCTPQGLVPEGVLLLFAQYKMNYWWLVTWLGYLPSHTGNRCAERMQNGTFCTFYEVTAVVFGDPSLISKELFGAQINKEKPREAPSYTSIRRC
jgi:hypothetical protein